MTEITVIRHAQASFGAADYDVLSELGHRQSEALGRMLAQQIPAPVLCVTGEQRRHRETLEGIAKGMSSTLPVAAVHPGLNEFDFKGLLDAHHRTLQPDGMHSDRKTHFKTLRDTVLAWQNDEVEDPPETWHAFQARVTAARDFLCASDGPVLAISSGGAISLMIAISLSMPPSEQINLQLQMKNCAVNRFISTKRGIYLHGYNETPHINLENSAEMLTYS